MPKIIDLFSFQLDRLCRMNRMTGGLADSGGKWRDGDPVPVRGGIYPV